MYDASRYRDSVYFTMECVDGLTLSEAIHLNRYTAPLRCNLIAQLAEGLHAIHMAKVIHRDIKSLLALQNILDSPLILAGAITSVSVG